MNTLGKTIVGGLAATRVLNPTHRNMHSVDWGME